MTWAAYRAERPVISGGRRIANWRAETRKGRQVWVADLPEVRRGEWNFRQLFVDGERAPRTRLPKRGFFRVQEALDYKTSTPPWACPTRRIRFASGDLKKWRNLRDVEIVALTRWIENRLPLASVCTQKRVAAFDRPSRHSLLDERGKGLGAPYWVENVFEALDTPGHWYLDRPRGRLYYLPKRGQRIGQTEIIAPRLRELLRVEGTARKKAGHVRFEGITFAHTEWAMPEGWSASGQAAHEVPGAIVLKDAVGCSFLRCAVEHVGGYAVEVLEGCLDTDIRHCRLADLGAGGVKIGHESTRTTVSDCEIAHGGRLFRSAVGVWIGHSPANKILHNHIHDLYYTGISVGGVWGYARSKAVGNVIEYNHVHDIGHGLLSDMGGIYTLGVSPGTRLRFNRIHDVACRVYGGWGIYADEGSTDLLVEKNIAYRCNSGPFHQHYGRDNLLLNNIFALGADSQIQRSGIEDHTSFIFRRNIVYFDRGNLMGKTHLNTNCAFEQNLYFDASGRPVQFYGKTFEEWQALGQDIGSVIADPCFVCPEKGDFRFRPDAPLAVTGFEAFDLSAAGPRKPG
jgi:hypothetical protein